MSNSRHRHGPRSLVADRYYILTEIGTGGMGTVYRGRDRHTGRAVAIKLLHPHLRRDPVYVARFRREADLATRLDSRHIVQVLDYGVDDGEPYIVMEFIEGQTLAELLLQGPLSQAGAAHVGVQIARALEEAHDKGVIHRDIKPRNVLIQPDGAIKVADFGIARSEDSDTGTQTNEIGAAAYMAPERFSPGRFGLVDARTDVYSLGVVLYEMLAGYPPFSGDTYELLHAILEEQPQPIEELRPELEPAVTELIGACLAKQTADRPATAAEVRLTLQPLADASQLNRPRPSGLKRLLLLPLLPFALMRGKPTRSRDYRRTAARGTRSRPAIVLVGVAALVTVAAVVLGFVLLSRSGDKSPQQAQLLAPTAAAAVTAAAVSPTPASCIEGTASPIGQALTRCPTARTAYIPSCPLGQACASTTDATGTQVLAVNDATIALVDNSGALIIARPDGSVVQHLSNRGQVQQPAWSPDGRYLAYVSSQQLPASDQTPGTFYATQLRIVEPQNAGNDWVVVASTQEPGTDEAYRRLISWPHWSADGKSLLFLWDAGTADGIFQVDLPFQDRGLDPSRLVKEPPSGNFYAVSPLRRLSLTADAFGYPAGYIGEFATATDGRLFVQFCDSKVGPRQCGLGQWDGRQAKVVVPFPKESFVLDQPALLPGTDDLYAYVRSLSNTDQLLHVNVASGQTNKVSDVARDLTLSPFLPTIGIANDGKTLLVATGAKPDALASLSLSDGQTKPWGPGYAPSWFVPVTTTDAPKTLPSDVWTAPTPTPSPTPVPVRRALPMTVSIDVRRAGSTLASAQVVALVDGQECANGTTDASGHLLLTVPSDDAAAACFKPGATVTFRVNGTQVPNQVTFTSQAAAQAPISLP